VLFKATGSDSETFERVYWDASAYLGTECYIKVVDNSTGDWGHINVDDINVGMFDTNLTGDWVTISGEWSNVTGGKLGTNSEGNSFCLNTQTGSDFVLEGDIKPIGGKAGGLVFRANSDATQFYCANVDTNGYVKLWKSDGSVLATYYPTINSNTTYKLKIAASGSNIKVYFNDKADPVINVNDSSFTSGQFGLNVFNGSSIFQSIRLSTLNTNLKGWYSPSGVWFDVIGGKQGVSSNSFLMSTTIGDNFVYEGDFTVTSTSGSAGLVFRSNANATKFYCASIDLGSTIKLWGPDLEDKITTVTIEPNTVYHLKVVTAGSNIQVFFNEETTAVLNVDDSTYTSGYFGLNICGTAVVQNIIEH
jgi:hypothetical protein